MYWSPNFLVVVFKKQEIPQQVVNRKQNLASEFSKFSVGDTPGPSQREEGPLTHPTPSPDFGRARLASAPVLGPKPWSPSTFQPRLRPWRSDVLFWSVVNKFSVFHTYLHKKYNQSVRSRALLVEYYSPTKEFAFMFAFCLLEPTVNTDDNKYNKYCQNSNHALLRHTNIIMK